MGDNRYENQPLDPIIQRCLVLTDSGVIRFVEPMAQQDVTTIYNPNNDVVLDINQRTEINEYFLGDIEPKDSIQIIGWTQEIKGSDEIMLFRQTDNLFITDAAMEVFTDTIFPVLIDRNLLPFGYQVVFIDPNRALMDTSCQLVLMDPMDKRQRTVRNARVSLKDNPLNTKIIYGYNADLRLFTSGNSQATSVLLSQAVIQYIHDKRDPECPLLGLYAGPDLPPELHRQCWYIFKPNYKPEHRSPFRHSFPKKPFVRRIGYLVSKQSLLCVCEGYQGQSLNIHTQQIFTAKPDDHYFTSLLKDNMFCISDSRHTYINDKHKAYEEMTLSPFTLPFEPKVVVLPEGLNSIVIHDVNTTIECKRPYDYIVSQLSGQRLYIKDLMTLDWYQFQSDFDRYNQAIGHYFQPIATLNHIHDYYLRKKPGILERLCFSLYNSIKIKQLYYDHYHLYTELPPQAGVPYRGPGYFHYFKSISFIWQVLPKPEGSPDLNRYYIYERYMKHELNQYLPTHEQTFTDQLSWILRDGNNQKIAYTLANLSIHQTENLSPVSMTKMLLIRDYRIVFIDPDPDTV